MGGPVGTGGASLGAGWSGVAGAAGAAREPCARGMKSMVVSRLSRSWLMTTSSLVRRLNFLLTAMPTRTSPVSLSSSTDVTSPMRTPDRRTGVPTATPGASVNKSVYVSRAVKTRGVAPKNTTSTARSTDAPTTNIPSRNRWVRASMG
jgi:hypothetical protein